MTRDLPGLPHHETALRAPGFVRLLALVSATFAGFGLLLPASPAWVAPGGSGSLGAGLVTTIFMFTTVVAQLSVNRVLRAAGWTPVLIAGILLIAAPAPLQAISNELWLILVNNAVRGIGFGILTVCTATALSALTPAAARGKAVGWYGLAIALPQMVFTSVSPWLVGQVGAPIVLCAGAIPLIALLWVLPLGAQLDEITAAQVRDVAPGARWSLIRRIWPALLALIVVTSAGGAMLTFAAEIAPSALAATVALVLFTGWAMPARWTAGSILDRFGTRWLTLGLLVVAAAALVCIGLSITPSLSGQTLALLWAGASVLGIAYGALQTTTLVRAFHDGGAGHEPSVSVAWNVTFDVGIGAGALALGAVAQYTSFTAAFIGIAACALLVMMLLAYASRVTGTR